MFQSTRDATYHNLQLDTWVAQHEEEEVRAERAQQAAMAEDGWTVVVRSKVSAKVLCKVPPISC